MVKICIALLVTIVCVSPAFAQDYPQVELAFGYGNLSLPNAFETGGLGIGNGGHHGFATHQIFNVSSWMGIENYLGYYALGDGGLGKTELVTTMFGGKFSLRRSDRIVPYVSAGLGGGWLRFPELGGGSNNSFSTRYGGGADVLINDSLAIKFDLSRMSFHFDGWQSGLNFSTGIVLRITQ